jgi:integrase
MAHLTRVHRTRYFLGGHRVPKDTKGAKKVTEKSDIWYGCKIPGQPPKKRIPLATDREAAERMLAKMVREAEKGIANVPNKKAASTPLADYLKEFKSSVTLGMASKGGLRRRLPNEKQVALVVQRVRDLLAGCGFEYPSDLNSDAAQRLAEHLHERMAQPRTKKDKGVSAQTANFIVAAARRFARWLHEKVSTVRPDLFDRIPAFDAANARTHARREVTPEELDRVLSAARASTRTIRKLTGEDRYHLYLTAFATGFRASELATLTPAHFHLSDDAPSVALAGRSAKNKKTVRHPIPPAVAVALRSYFAGKAPTQPLWSSKWTLHAAKMLRVDLAAAGVPYCVEGVNGKEFADFHALRHTFVSALAASGAGAKELQTLARHSDPRLTLGLYTHARSTELAKAVGRLKVPGAEAVTPGPLSHLDRGQLEGLVMGLLVLLGSILLPAGHSAPQSLGAPRGAPAVGDSGNPRELLDTTKRGRKAVG